MIDLLPFFFSILYFVCLLFISLYGIAQFILLIKLISKKNSKVFSIRKMEVSPLPFITVQLPVFNEYFVIERLIDCIANLDYPKDKLEIQLLDDSNDESFELGRIAVERYQKLGLDIVQIKRPKRVGYKAGALAYGLEICKGEFIAIFDADFLPEKDFLINAIAPFFQNEKIGVVQATWGHINRNYSWLTRAQALALDTHFYIEQSSRFASDHLLHFNGTAGIWKKQAIIDSGNWNFNTLTEDLDLSMRAQLNGYKIFYLRDLLVPAELPVEIQGIKSQQYRWIKGGAECARIHIPNIINSSLSWGDKLQTTIHLLNSSVFVGVFFGGMISLILILFFSDKFSYSYLFRPFIIISVILFINAWYANVLAQNRFRNKFLGTIEFIIEYIIFLGMALGLSFHNSLACIRGWAGIKSPFVRTPKFAITDSKSRIQLVKYHSWNLPRLTIFEFVLGVLFLIGCIKGILVGNYGFVVYHGILSLGFLSVSILSVKSIFREK
jgi:cellulose synthase/poly-beta-1,6-N-acetylglucosamine synthase-like glycosyltransferase